MKAATGSSLLANTTTNDIGTSSGSGSRATDRFAVRSLQRIGVPLNLSRRYPP